MKFGRMPLDDAIGGILAHSVRLPDDTRLKKGTVLDDELIDLMHAASMETVMVALPGPKDVLEDDAARRIAARLDNEGIRVEKPSTGRVNLFAEVNGVFRVSKEIIDAINAADPGITVATLPDCSEVNSGRMVATVKIIPYAVSEDAVLHIEAMPAGNALSMNGYARKKIGLVLSRLPGTKEGVLEKTRMTLESRLMLSGSMITTSRTVLHQEDAVAEAVKSLIGDVDVVVIFGASAISDARDVIPAAIEAVGGELIRFGMPVDPGNLLLLASLDEKPVIGAPGCARSKAENGFDWVLQRILAGIPVDSDIISQMGVGGLLMETGARPHPREVGAQSKGKVAALILAAGQSRRMGSANKMTVPVDGKPMVRHVAEAAIHSDCDHTIVVTGHEPQDVTEALNGLDVELVHNQDYAAGLSSSLKAGVSAVSSRYDQILVLLGDMPLVDHALINQLIQAGRENTGSIVVACSHGKRGNPVLWPKQFFPELTTISGDTGARHIIGQYEESVVEVETGDAAAVDLDTPDAVAAFMTGRERD